MNINKFNNLKSKINFFWKWKFFLFFFILFFLFLLYFITIYILQYFLSKKEIIIFFNKTVLLKDRINQNSNNSISDIIPHFIYSFLYLIFVLPLGYVIKNLSLIIKFIETGSFNKIIISEMTFNNANIIFKITFWLSISFLAIFIIYFLFSIIIAHSASKQASIGQKVFRDILLVIILIPLIPSFFSMINQIFILIISYVTPNKSFDLSILIFNDSFLDGTKDFTSLPLNFDFKDKENFSFLIIICSYSALTYLLIKIILDLLVRSYEILLLFMLSLFILSSIVSDKDSSYRYFKNYFALLVQRWAMFFGFF